MSKAPRGRINQSILLAEQSEILKIGLSLLEGFFRLAAISFAINAVLLAATQFLMSGGLPDPAIYAGLAFVGLIGVVYNAGALSAYSCMVTTARNLYKRLREIDALIPTKIGECIADGLPFGGTQQRGTATVFFTKAFFFVLVFSWVALPLFGAWLTCRGRL